MNICRFDVTKRTVWRLWAVFFVSSSFWFQKHLWDSFFRVYFRIINKINVGIRAQTTSRKFSRSIIQFKSKLEYQCVTSAKNHVVRHVKSNNLLRFWNDKVIMHTCSGMVKRNGKCFEIQKFSSSKRSTYQSLTVPESGVTSHSWDDQHIRKICCFNTNKEYLWR